MSTHYTYRVTWSHEDQEHVALCAEFPSLSYLADTPAGALQGMIDMVDDIISDMRKSGEDVPEPISERSYSGKLMLRIPPEQHRNLAIAAAEQGISLNRHIVSKL